MSKSKVAEDAARVWSQGGQVFTAVYGDDVALTTEQVLAVGWRLHTWAAVPDKYGRPQAMPLFVRQ